MSANKKHRVILVRLNAELRGDLNLYSAVAGVTTGFLVNRIITLWVEQPQGSRRLPPSVGLDGSDFTTPIDPELLSRLDEACAVMDISRLRALAGLISDFVNDPGRRVTIDWNMRRRQEILDSGRL